jgi:histo-blood group ABO system transferase
MRFGMYHDHKDVFEGQDYVFACDADMLFVADVPESILSDRIATRHPYFWDGDESKREKLTYEDNPVSAACIRPDEGAYYFCGGVFGGKTENFLHMAQTIASNIESDLRKHFIAVWHDESHVNRYFIDYPPTLILTPSYCYPEHNIYEKKRNLPQHILVALEKNKGQLRS